MKSMLRKRTDRRKQKHEIRESAVFASGHPTEMDEARLHKSGVRGRKSIVLAVGFGFVVLVSIANLVVTSVLVDVLKMTPEGVPSLHIDSDHLLVFREPMELKNLYVNKFLGGFQNENLSVGSRKEVKLKVGIYMQSQSEIVMKPEEVVVNPIGLFRVTTKSNSVVFEAGQSAVTIAGIKGSKVIARNINRTGIQCTRIYGNGNVKLLSPSTIDLNAGGDFLLQARKATVLTSKSKAINLDTRLKNTGAVHLLAHKGIYLNMTNSNVSGGTDRTGRILCACLANSSYVKLYSVPSTGKRCLALANPCNK
ncbi:beta-sarcoglycan-like isoform X2 [Corticium candelabrum]|uniref:beta-sarcoglycan-like isoform X2 n=1 Tax=Corticium candelabrum TaxID=121492 RepID=UPI002E2696A4|nr:beta-sarcoglycan-like isoform X2 [Corticium candelabrum]